MLGLVFLIGRRLERPVHKHRPPHDIFLRHKSPEAPIRTLRPVVPHRKHFARRHNQVAIHNVRRQLLHPGLGSQAGGRRTLRWKFITTRLISVFRVGIVRRHLGLRLILRDAVQIHHAVHQMNAISRNPNHPLHQNQIRLTPGSAYKTQ